MPEKTAKKNTEKKVSKTVSGKEFAVIETGGKQYTVKVGDVVKIEKLAGEHKEGDKITFEKVLLVDNGQDTTIGTPYISGAKVEGTYGKTGRSAKVLVLRYRQKSRYRKVNTHRQPFATVKIEAIK